MRILELNADVGELPGPDGRAADRAILEVVTAASIACGAHAGDDEMILETLRACRELGVAAGAHPGYPDREGFGRRKGSLSAQEIRATVREQIERFAEHAARVGIESSRVKPHGALYNEAAVDRAVAEPLLRAVADVFPNGTLLALAKSPLVKWTKEAGLQVLSEGFADRAYREDGTLVPRTEPGALVDGLGEAAERAVSLATRGRIQALHAGEIVLAIDTLCLHGEAPGAVARSRAVRGALESAGVILIAH